MYKHVCVYFHVSSINLGQRPSSKSYAKRVVHLLIRAHQNFEMFNVDGVHTYVSMCVSLYVYMYYDRFSPLPLIYYVRRQRTWHVHHLPVMLNDS